MKHAFKKTLAMLLVLAMVIGVIPSVFAAKVATFTDVDETDWFAPFVEYVYEHDPQLMNGTSATTFEPEGTCTRAMAAVVLYRLADPVIPSVKPSTFTDLTQDWYKNGIAWAQQKGVVNGIGGNLFDPDGLVTREQLVTMLWRYAGSPKVEGDFLKGFPDANQISDYAKEAFNWAISMQIIQGSDGKLLPKDNATRAQFAKIISVFDEATKPCEEHTWDEGKVTKEPTCTEEGEIVYTCERCGETKTEALPATGHHYSQGVCTGCGDKLASEDEIVIYYTNDVHTYIDGALSYDNIADLKAQTKYVAAGVLLLDAGDHVQGTAYGSMDKGKTIIELMAAADYDAATLGNHEFDYGMERTLEITKQAGFPYLSCNFYNEKNGVAGNSVLDAYKIFTVGGKKIAVVGITTPESFTKSTPKYFQDEAGNYIYGIAGGTDGAALYGSVQTAVDAAKKAGADYVIALGHLGDDSSSKPWTSEEVIANTNGIDAFIDGHSHSTVEMKEVKNKDGKTVVLTQTGSYFNAIGRMSITKSGIKTELISEYTGSDTDVAAIKNNWIAEIDKKLGEVIGHTALTFDNYDKDGNRLVRSQETNTGDFAADALYYLFDNMDLDVDLAIMNGGGVRNKAITGDISYKTCKEIHTFGNVACLIQVTGQQILDALEWGARDVGTAECGGFLQVSGVTYEIHTYITSTVQKDDKGVWTAGPTGEYRVKNVKIGGEPLDLTKTYNMAGYNYTLRDCGDGFAMFKGAANVLDYVMEDYMVLANYVKSFPTKNGKHEIEAQNSVLGANYAEITGEGRITVVPSKGESKDEFVLASEIKGGDEVVIYNPGHGMAIKNETDNDWYLMPETVTPVNNKIVGPDAILVWTVVDNGNGTFSFVNGENKIMMWLSEQGEKTYFELTNNANYEGATGEWKVVSGDAAKNLYYIQHSTLSNSYGPAYIECFYNSNKNTTKISGYSTSSPSANDYGFQFYVKGATTPDPEPTPGNEYVLTSELKEGDEVIIVCAAKNIAFSSEKNPEKNYYNAGVAVTPVDGKITDAPTAIVWTVGKDGENYTFSFNGQKIGMADSFSSTDLGAVNDTWAIETAKTDGAFYLKNLGRNLWLEWYADNNYWSCYKDNSNEELFALNFYVKSAVTPEPTPTPGNEYVLTSELKEGDEVVVVCAAKNIAFSSEKNPEKNYYNAGVAVTPVDGKITDAPAAIVWTVGKDGENYTFSFNGQKIGMADSFSSTDLGAVNDTWAIETAKTDGAFYLKNLGRNLWLEWYADNNYWSCYKDNSNEELFALNFYVKSGSGEAPHVHAWDAGIVTKEATCTEKGVKTFTCECGATKTEEIAALGHIDENNDDVCDRCNADLGTIAAEEYVLASEIKDGDEVVIYNPANSAALSSVASGYNLAPVSVTPVSNAITTNDATIVWTVTKNADGSYTFTQDGGVVLGAEVSGSYTDIYATGEHANTWTLTALSTENLFDITSTTLEGTYGPVFVEYYNNAFKAFSTSRTSSYYSEAAMGFQFYVKGGEAACVHEWDEGKVTTEATCTTAGVKTFTCAKCGATKTEEIEALGHIDENNDDVCDRCNADLGTIVAEEYILASEIKDGDEVVIYNPGHGKAIKNENDNNWYLIAEEITPADSKITTTDTSLVWTVNKNDDGTFTFTNGANAITAWLSGTYVELTNDASYAGGDTKWNVTTCNAETNTFFIGSSSISTSYGTGYIECYTKSGVDKIAGYAKTSPTEYDFGFQFYVKGAEAACAHEWDEGEVTTEATCTTAGVKTFTCAKCEATKTEPIAPLGHIDENGDNVCDRCGADLTPSDYAIADSLTVGDKIIIVAEYEGKYYAVANNIANSALSGEEVTVSGSGLTLPEDADVAWEVCAGSTEGTFTLKNKDGLYIAVPTTGSSKTAVTLADVGTDYAITCGEGTSKIALPGAERSLFLHMNGTIAQFKHYADSNSGSSGYSAVLTIWKAN